MCQGKGMRIKTVFAGLLLLVLVGCQTINTTDSGVVGVQREQRMFALLSAEQVDTMSAAAYHNTIKEAGGKKTLNTDDATLKRLRRIAANLVDETRAFRVDAQQWRWEVNVIQSDVMNASCMPGGKILFYSGIIDRLKLTDDEIAAIMGHEMAHALREHGREAMSEAYAVELGRGAVGALLGLDGNVMGLANNVVQYALTLPNSREKEAEADIIGLELMARAGYHPQAAVTLWQKMARQGGDQPPEFMSTHPATETRIEGLRHYIPKVMPLYHQARNYSS
ncbi:M48 family metallopeptidase [Kistimonas scapharcae]|uniref:M48 family metallopeptidase n=2 Tax=Kistimonas scapharcae TaxID=1036133 RepID=A0ABP8UYT0_9GAMM